MGQLSHLEQVKLDAERITRKRIREAAEEKAWQESKEGGVALGEAEEAIAEVKLEEEAKAETKAKKATVKTKKGK